MKKTPRYTSGTQKPMVIIKRLANCQLKHQGGAFIMGMNDTDRLSHMI